MLSSPKRRIIDVFEVREWLEYDEMPLFRGLSPRYNIAPTQPIAIIEHHQGSRRLRFVRWGLIPSWVKDPSDLKSDLINARAEGIGDKPSFRAAFRQRRCLVPADGFYEWQARGKAGKQPYLIRRSDGQPLALAGLCEHWQDAHGNEIDSATIITTSANSLLRPIHERMPVILPPAAWAAWLGEAEAGAEDLAELLKPCDLLALELTPVSRRINTPANEGASLLKPDVPALQQSHQPGLLDDQ